MWNDNRPTWRRCERERLELPAPKADRTGDRIDALAKRLAVAESSLRLLTAEARKQRAFNEEILVMLGYKRIEK